VTAVTVDGVDLVTHDLGMTLTREDISQGLLQEMESFEQLIRSLDESEWATPTRCDGWTVSAVASHFIGQMGDVVAGRLDGLGSPEVTQREVDERVGRSPAELADELHGVRKTTADLLAVFDDDAWNAHMDSYDGTLGDGVEALWFDGYVHGDDIRAAIGRPSERGDGLRASASHLSTELTKASWGPATLALEGLPEFEVSGGGRRVEGDPLAFVLAATGRGDPAAIGVDASVNVYG
jgi:uncharacterized protein (TIGR03083 family)